MRLSISHDTTYRYEDRVRASIQYLRLTPQDSERQHVVDWRLDLPRPARPQRDPYGNILHVLTLDEPHESVLIAAHGLVEIDEESEVEHDRQSPLPFLRSTRLTGADAEMRAFAERALGGRKDRGGLLDLMHALHERIAYQPGATRVDSTAIEPSALAPGSARTTPTPSSPAFAARACRGAMCPAISTPRTRRTWPATPGPRPGSATAGTAST